MAADPYRYFRVEAHELLESLGHGVLALEQGPADRALVARLLREAHTLKGAARVVRQPRMAEQVHALEDALEPFREGAAPVPRERIERMLGLLDAVSAAVAALGPGAEAPAESSPAPAPAVAVPPVAAPEAPRATPPPEPPLETVRVEVGEMDALLEGVAETGVHVAALRRSLDAVEKARHLADALAGRLDARRVDVSAETARVTAHLMAEELAAALRRLERTLPAGVDRVGAELAQVGDAARRLRLLPASAIFAPLERAARDAAASLDKRVEFRATGGDVRLDAQVLGAVRDAFLHAVRNAVAHGVEAPGGRAAAGKPAAGRVEVAVERRGARVVFACRDDGAGVDVEGLRAAAVRGGRATEAEARAMDLDGLVGLALGGGVSTARGADQVSGRGVGLDVVRATAEQLKGTVSVRSERGRGTTLELSVPAAVACVTVLTVDVGSLVSIPLDAVRHTLSLTDADLARGRDGDAVVYEGRAIPYATLGEARARTARGARSWPAVVVQSGAELAAVGVRRLLGVGDVIVRPLPALAAADPTVAGASIDGEGNPRLVLDPAALVASARGRRREETPRPAEKLPVLVIDDSLTTRMLEQSILESAGYEVDLATSAEEGMERAQARRYGLFVVDVEMPGMDGFEFVTRTRADPALRGVPAVLVTSRDAPEDRRRGEQAGARAYIVKGEFDQGALLDILRDVVGA